MAILWIALWCESDLWHEVAESHQPCSALWGETTTNDIEKLATCLLSVLLSVCLLINPLSHHALKCNFVEAKNSVTQNRRPVVFCILGCTQSSRPTWFNGWWHPIRSVWQGDSKSRRPEQRWLPWYIWKAYISVEWFFFISPYNINTL